MYMRSSAEIQEASLERDVKLQSQPAPLQCAVVRMTSRSTRWQRVSIVCGALGRSSHNSRQHMTLFYPLLTSAGCKGACRTSGEWEWTRAVKISDSTCLLWFHEIFIGVSPFSILTISLSVLVSALF
jgi:hypothetical protein